MKQKLGQVGQGSGGDGWNSAGKVIAIDIEISQFGSTAKGRWKWSTEVVETDVDDSEGLGRVKDGIRKPSIELVVANVKELQCSKFLHNIGKRTAEGIIGKQEIFKFLGGRDCCRKATRKTVIV